MSSNEITRAQPGSGHPASGVPSIPEVHDALRRLSENPDWQTVIAYLIEYTGARATAYVKGSFDQTAYWLGKQDVIRRLEWVENLPPATLAKLQADLAAPAPGPDGPVPVAGRRGPADLFQTETNHGENPC
jgi:hypothetical protein